MDDQKFSLDLDNSLVLEFYGALLGDGWLTSRTYYTPRKYLQSIVGMSGHSINDREYLLFIKDIMALFFHQEPRVTYKRKQKAMEVRLYNKEAVSYLHNLYNFPFSYKPRNLRIKNDIVNKWDRLQHVIRGIFDTDGSFYFDKDPLGKPYPIISITMRAPLLLSQIEGELLKRGFRLSRYYYEIKLKGTKQLKKWMSEIGSSNPHHKDKINKWLAPVAQPG